MRRYPFELYNCKAIGMREIIKTVSWIAVTHARIRIRKKTTAFPYPGAGDHKVERKNL